MTIKDELKICREDFKYIQSKFGEIPDYCGAWCNCDVLMGLLLKDNSNKKIIELLENLISLYFDSALGYGDKEFIATYVNQEDCDNDERLQGIADKYYIDVLE